MEPLRVLIVDDEAPARRKVRRFLQAAAGVEVAGEAGDGPGAVEAIREHRPDLVVLDIQMPGMGGFEVLEALAESELPHVVFATAYDAYAIRATRPHEPGVDQQPGWSSRDGRRARVFGQPATFTGSATDAQDGALSGFSLLWSAEPGGSLGFGASVTTSALAPGPHIILLTAIDADVAVAVDTITVTVVVNAPPVVTITAPPNPTTVTFGTPLTFTGSALDPESGALGGGALVWRSNLDGVIGTGVSFTTATLSAGTHQLELRATDPRGASASEFVTVTVPVPLAVFVGPTPYLCHQPVASDPGSPCLPFPPDFVVETFEAFTGFPPGVSASVGARQGPGTGFTDSVDCDQGSFVVTPTGNGDKGSSWFAAGAAEITFSFAGMDVLPTRAGVVWTDGGDVVTFEAFDGAGNSLGTLGPIAAGDEANDGGTAEDRFFGVTYAGGIGSITVRQDRPGMEVDHLQLGN